MAQVFFGPRLRIIHRLTPTTTTTQARAGDKRQAQDLRGPPVYDDTSHSSLSGRAAAATTPQLGTGRRRKDWRGNDRSLAIFDNETVVPRPHPHSVARGTLLGFEDPHARVRGPRRGSC